MAIEILGLMEVCQVLVADEDLDGKEEPMEVVPLRLQGLDDGQEFLVIDIVIVLCQDK